jgi:glycosyltransferase involved in cell wall biosynthesis
MTPACHLPEGLAAGAALRIEPATESIAATLREIYRLSPAELQAMGGKGRILVETKFDWREVAAQLASVYGWILGGGAKPACVEGP